MQLFTFSVYAGDCPCDTGRWRRINDVVVAGHRDRRFFLLPNEGAHLVLWERWWRLAALAGPSLGGVLVNLFGWPSIFIINIPIGIIGAVLAFTVIPEIFEKQTDKSFDFKGMVYFAFCVLSLFLGMLFVQQGTFPAIYLIPAVLFSAASLGFLISTEKKSTNPLVNLQMFSEHEFSFGLISAFLSFIALSSTLLFLPFYLQEVLKFSALKAGLIISVYPVTMAIVAPAQRLAFG